MFQRPSLVHHQVIGDEWCVCPLLTYTSQNPHEPVRCRYKHLAHITYCISNLMLGDSGSFQNAGYQVHRHSWSSEKTLLHIITIKLNESCICTSTCNAVANFGLCDSNECVFILLTSVVIQILKISLFLCYVYVRYFLCFSLTMLEFGNVPLGSVKCHECLG